MGFITGGRRRKILVDRRFQVTTAVVGIVYILAVAIVLAVPLVEMMQDMDALLAGESNDLASYKSRRSHTIASLGLFLVGILGAWTVFSLWRSHRIAGPLVKITRYVHQFATGNFKDRIELRERDQLQALARALNNMAASLDERDQVIREGILDQVEAVRCGLLDTPSADRGVQALEQLADSVNRSYDAKWETPANEEARAEAVRI